MKNSNNAKNAKENDSKSQPSWVVNDRDNWDSLYSRSIAVYWAMCDAGEHPSLYDVYKQFGVANIKPSEDGAGVIFCSSNQDGEIAVVKPKLKSKAEFISDKNVWNGLKTDLSIKIPNRIRLQKDIIDWHASLCETHDLMKMIGECLVSSYWLFPSTEKGHESAQEFLKNVLKPYNAAEYTANIPTLMFVMGVIDRYIAIFGPDENFRRAFYHWDFVVGSALTKLLSDWTELGRFFPFGFLMGEQQSSVRPPYVHPTPDPSVVKPTHPLAPLNYPLRKYNYPGSKASKPLVSEINNNNRGGAPGMNEDYDWEHFAPKMVAYNWKAMRALNGGIRHESSLSEYQEMLDILEFSIPSTTNINIQLEDQQPWDENEKRWNYQAYVPTILAEYPAVPRPVDRPMAMCDLISDRANEPFTCF